MAKAPKDNADRASGMSGLPAHTIIYLSGTAKSKTGTNTERGIEELLPDVCILLSYYFLKLSVRHRGREQRRWKRLKQRTHCSS